MSRKQKPFIIPGFLESVKNDFEAGLITLDDAATEFYKANWTAFKSIEYTKKMLGI
ncbi:hypothetical protein QLG07_12215 [Erwinia sp. V90_4]|uniref:hypothetical protein n=1 Tax=Erwinia sp. V90_4 TaxID=3044239 RepID=UPI00249F8657|nr:hypothetical protein [Erwinia sp. V90_4]MDI3440226.1 hypothetical protein [Erwinia sp. V90_4]